MRRALAALLGDEKLSHLARYGLEPIPDPAVDEALRAALGELKGRPLIGVIGSLGVRRDKNAVAALAGLLKDSDPAVARAAARSLGRIGDAPATQALEKALEAATPATRLAVSEGLFRCADHLTAHGKTKEARARSARSSIAPTRLRRSVPPPSGKPASWLKKLRLDCK